MGAPDPVPVELPASKDILPALVDASPVDKSILPESADEATPVTIETCPDCPVDEGPELRSKLPDAV
jgi:hypothetical protein